MTKEFEPDDPMELVGVEIPGGDPDQLIDDIVLEYMSMGWSPRQIAFLFRSPNYGATHQIYKQRGEAFVKNRIQDLAQQWQAGWINSAGGDTNAPGL